MCTHLILISHQPSDEIYLHVHVLNTEYLQNISLVLWYSYHFLSLSPSPSLPPLPLSSHCSPYRVYVVPLSERALPGIPPDELFSDDSRISTYDPVTQTVEDPFESQYLAYIAAEIDATQFNTRFTIGDGSQTDREEQFPNGPLQANSLYTFFLRAYPKMRGDFPSSFRTRRESSSRQYVVFSSSGYTAISSTGK